MQSAFDGQAVARRGAGRRPRDEPAKRAFQMPAAVFLTASDTASQSIWSAGPVTDTAAIARPELRIGAATQTSP